MSAVAGVTSHSSLGAVTSRHVRRRGLVRRVPIRAGAATMGKNQHGTEIVQLSADDGACATVYPFGACCTSWTPYKGGRDVLYCRPDAKFDKSKPISGGIPHCFPQFGPGKMQQHGFARNLDWAVTKTDGGKSPCVEMTLTDNDYTREMWPFSFKAVHTITLMPGGQLEAKLSVTNTDSKPFDFTASFHTYLSLAAGIEEARVSGLSGSKVSDRLANTEGTQSGDVAFTKAIDSVYFGADPSLTLHAGADQNVKIDASGGWVDAVVWNPWTDMESCYKEFVCVENAVLGTPAVAQPGAIWTAISVFSA